MLTHAGLSLWAKNYSRFIGWRAALDQMFLSQPVDTCRSCMSSFSNHLTPTSEPNLAKFHGEVALRDYIREISVERYEDRFLKTITPKALGA